MSVYYVYILETISKNGMRQYYTGYTKNLYKRLYQHKKGRGSKFCRGKDVISLKYFESYLSRSEAMKRELEIKSFSKKKKEEMINSFKSS